MIHNAIKYTKTFITCCHLPVRQISGRYISWPHWAGSQATQAAAETAHIPAVGAARPLPAWVRLLQGQTLRRSDSTTEVKSGISLLQTVNNLLRFEEF